MPRKPQPWFRFYVEAVHDRKLRRLKPEFRWLFVACLAAARQSPEPGWLMIDDDDPMTAEDLADFAGMTQRATEAGLLDLERVGIVTFVTDECAWFVPAWHERQFESDNVTARTAKHRSKEQGRNVPTEPVGTPPEDREQNPDTEPSSSSNDAKFAEIDAVDDEDDPILVQAKAITRDAIRAGQIRTSVSGYFLAVISDLRAKGWKPKLDAMPCTDPDCVLGWLEPDEDGGERWCPYCRPWLNVGESATP